MVTTGGPTSRSKSSKDTTQLKQLSISRYVYLCIILRSSKSVFPPFLGQEENGNIMEGMSRTEAKMQMDEGAIGGADGRRCKWTRHQRQRRRFQSCLYY
jgi:hypothetical protein